VFVLAADGSVDQIADFSTAEGDKLVLVYASGAPLSGVGGMVVLDAVSGSISWDPDGDSAPQAAVKLATFSHGLPGLDSGLFAPGFTPTQMELVEPGGKVITAFDQSGQPADHSVASFDLAGKLYEFDVYNDDGSHTQTWFDNLGNQDWSAREADYDSLGRMTQYAYRMDDGTETIWQHDPANLHPWDHTLQVYSPNGALETSALGMDDGSGWQRTYDWNNTQPWSVMLDEYASSGALIRHTVTNDDGTIIVT
jgi:hypothetical protein